MGIQVVEGLEFRFQPILKLPAGAIVEGHQCIPVFVVDLPAHNLGIMSEADCHLLGYLAAEFPITRRTGRGARGCHG